MVGDLRSTLKSIDPEIAVVQAGTGLALADSTGLFFRIVAGLSGTLGLFALLLALAGLYGVLSHVIGRRTREIGLRLALGAERRQIIRLVIREGLGPVLVGLAIGAGVGIVARWSLQPLFVRLLPSFDPWALAAVIVLFLASGALREL